MYVLYITVLSLMYASDCVLSTSIAIPHEVKHFPHFLLTL